MPVEERRQTRRKIVDVGEHRTGVLAYRMLLPRALSTRTPNDGGARGSRRIELVFILDNQFNNNPACVYTRDGRRNRALTRRPKRLSLDVRETDFIYMTF